ATWRSLVTKNLGSALTAALSGAWRLPRQICWRASRHHCDTDVDQMAAPFSFLRGGARAPGGFVGNATVTAARRSGASPAEPARRSRLCPFVSSGELALHGDAGV